MGCANYSILFYIYPLVDYSNLTWTHYLNNKRVTQKIIRLHNKHTHNFYSDNYWQKNKLHFFYNTITINTLYIFLVVRDGYMWGMYKNNPRSCLIPRKFILTPF
ncbi:hypothetical protein ACJX0J_011449 [Zea mays]